MSADVTDALIEFLKARRGKGIRKYGRPLTSFNGRDARDDQMDELIDLVLYQRQEILELREVLEHGKAGSAPV